MTKILIPATVLLITIMLFQSCAVPAIPEGVMRFNKSKTENGLLIGSITFLSETPKFDSYFFRLSGNTYEEFMITSGAKHKGQLDEGRTYLFAIERPIGTYEIPSIRLFRNNFITALQRTSYIDGFSIPYEIKKGEITYIGNIIFSEYAQKGAKFLTLDNNFEKDINALKELKPSVDWKNAINNENIKIEYNNKKAKQ